MGVPCGRTASAALVFLLLQLASTANGERVQDPNAECQGVNKKILRETTRVGQNVVLPCGRTPESRQALANKTVVLWLAVPRGASPSGVHSGTITIPIVTREKTPNGHTFKATDRNERLVVNYENASLSVLNVTLADRKDFYCRVFRGPVCVYVVHVQLIVVDKPELPTNVTVETISDTKLKVRWKPGPDNFSPILGYKLMISMVRGSTTHEVNLTASANSYLVPHLEPYTKYSSCVRAINREGHSGWTKPVIQRTAEGRPTALPVLYRTNATNSSVSVSVVVVDSSERQMLGSLNGFDIEILNQGNELKQRQSKNGSVHKRTFTFLNLDPYTSYKVQARVRNGRYAGNWTSIPVRTKEGLPGKPRVFATDIVTENSFTVRWEEPGISNGVIKGYVVTVVDNKTGQEQILTTNNIAVHKLVIKNLSSYTKYLVYVAAQTSAGTGEKDGPRDVLTDVGPPPQPELLYVDLNISGSGVEMKWRPKHPVLKPEQTSYMLCWSDDGNTGYDCIHAQQSKPRQTAFIRIEVPKDSNGPVIYSAMLPANKLKSRNQNTLIWYFYVYGRTKSLYCTNDKHGTTPPLRLSLSRRRRLLSSLKSDQRCFYAGPNSNIKSLTISPSLWNRIDEQRENRAASDGSIMILFCILGFIIILVASSIGFYIFCRRCGTHRGYDLALTGGLERRCSNGRGIISGDVLEPLEPALLPTILPYSECGVAAIEAQYFPDHVANLHANSEAGFCQEFDEIDKSQMNSWPDSVARLPENSQKNRYTNIFPYDHTRVHMLNLQGRKSDYINANFIDGYDKKNAYIAAQGPMPATFEDFWQMIWEQRTNTIVMISNLIERGRLKCDQYWPSILGPEGSQQFGRIHVTLNSQEELAYYIVRELTIRNVKSKKFRHVYQYQYTDWPDFAVPESPLPVLVFIRKTVRHIGKGTGPILVHCSAGVGRTGTYLCIESQIRQYEREKNFNVRGFLQHIRQQRMKLVQTEEQYAFIHDALLMHYLCPYHEIPRNELSAYVKLLKETEPCSCVRLEREFLLCINYRPQDWELSFSIKPVNERKSRSDIYPTLNRQVALPAEPGVEGSNYINASYLQGYWRRDEFIVTQHPFEHTITDFWKMVWDQNSSQMILLSNAPNLEYPCFWPTNPDDTKEAGYLRVGFLSRKEHSHSTHLKFLVSSTREDYSLVSNMWICKAWPNCAEGCMDLFQFIRHDREKTGPFIVIDELGGSRAGIFCALNTLMDQLDKENTVDVYFVFKMFHRQRPGIWQSQADLEFVYDAIERYSREPPPVHTAHPGSVSHHSSPGIVSPEGGGPRDSTGDRHLSVVCSDSLPRGGRLTPNGCTILAGADPTVSFYSNGGGTLPRLVVTTPNNGSATLDSNASRDASENNELPT